MVESQGTPEFKTESHSFHPDSLQSIDPQIIEKLKCYGEVNPTDDWSKYADFSFDDSVAKELMHILEIDPSGAFWDEEDDSFDDDKSLSPLAWVPLHAWRILITKKYVPAIPALIHRVTANDDDDWVRDEIPHGIASFGPVAVPYILATFKKSIIFGQEAYGYWSLVDALADIAKAHTETKGEVLTFLRDFLKDFEVLPPMLNSALIGALLDLGDAPSAPLIQRVFQTNFVDEGVVDWKWVLEKLPDAGLPATVVREKPKNNGFTYSGDERFQRLLKTLGSIWSIEEVKCLLVGSFLAVDMVQPSALAEQITQDIDGESEDFVTEGQAMYFYRELFGLYNELSEYQNKLFEIPKHRHPRIEVTPAEQARIESFWLKMGLIAFAQGLELGNTDEERLSGYDDGESFLEFIESSIEELDEVDKNKSLDSHVINNITSQIRSQWDGRYLKFAGACRSVRKAEIDRARFVQANKHVGRNEACPCGSGKKFKKCCLVDH
jgi:SEC-C motif